MAAFKRTYYPAGALQTGTLRLRRYGAARLPSGSDGHGGGYTYDAAARITARTDRRGHATSFAYDARGKVESTTEVNPCGDGPGATTRYTWDAKWGAVRTITLPMGEVTEFAYDPGNGNHLWMKPSGDATRPDTVKFSFHATLGMLESTRTPLSPADRIEYDALGNVRATVTPGGFHTLFDKDALGRDRAVYTPIDTFHARSAAGVREHGARQTIVYDVMDRVTRSESYGPELSHTHDALAGEVFTTPAEALIVRNFYNPEGALDSVARWASPDPTRIGTITTTWRYDRAGRAVAELAPGSGTFTETITENVCEDPYDVFTCRIETRDSVYTVEYRDSTVHDAAGNAVRQITAGATPSPWSTTSWGGLPGGSYPRSPTIHGTCRSTMERCGRTLSTQLWRARRATGAFRPTPHATDTMRAGTWWLPTTQMHRSRARTTRTAPSKRIS
jgi:YD repeat-containing protein